MGSLTETLRLLVEADTKGAVSEVEKLGKASEREASKAKNNLDRWGSGLTKVGAGMIAFGSVALVGLGHAAMASEEAAASSRKLQNSMENNPRLAGESAQSFIDLAESIQDKTAADADDIVAGEAVLAQGKLTAAQMRELIPLVVDLARKKGIDEVAAFTMAAKAADGNAGALKRAGIAVDEAKFKTDGFGATVDALKGSVGGFAEEEGKTFAGSLQRLKNQLGDIEEGVGKGAVDAFTTMFGAVDGVTEKLNDLSPTAQATIGKVGTYGAVALIAAGATSTLIGQVIKARDNFKSAWEAITNLRSGLSGTAGSITRFGLAIGTLAVAGQTIDEISGGIDHLDISKLENQLLRLAQTGKASHDLLDAAGGDLDKLRDAVERIAAPSIGTQIHNAGEEISTLGGLLGETGHDLEEDKALVDDFDKALAQLASRNPQLAAAALKQLTDQMNPEEADRFVGLLDDYDSALAEIDTSEAVAGTNELGGAFDDEGNKIDGATSALETWSDKLRGTFDPLFGMTDALQANSDAHADLEAKQMEALVAQDAYNDAVDRYGENSKAAHDAAAANMEAQTALTDAQRTAQGAIVDLQGAAYDLRLEMDQNGLTAEDARAKFIEMSTSMGYSRGEAERLAPAFGFATGAAQTLGRQRPEPHVEVRGWSSALNHLATVGQNLHDLDGDSANVNVNFSTTGFGHALTQLATLGMGLGHRAGGGPVGPGWAGWVGEDGPELLVMDPSGRGGHVYNDAQLSSAGGKVPALAGGGGFGGTTVINNFHIAGSVLSERELIRTINRANRKGNGLNGLNGRVR